MAHWLYKSEPDSWSWTQQAEAGEAGTPWTGVRNHLAKKHLQAMKRGDLGFFYHSNQGKAVVGIVEVVREYYPDATDSSGRFGCVDLKAVEALPEAVTLEEIKRHDGLAEMVLLKNSRLSVQPVTDAEWQAVRRLGGL